MEKYPSVRACFELFVVLEAGGVTCLNWHVDLKTCSFVDPLIKKSGGLQIINILMIFNITSAILRTPIQSRTWTKCLGNSTWAFKHLYLFLVHSINSCWPERLWAPPLLLHYFKLPMTFNLVTKRETFRMSIKIQNIEILPSLNRLPPFLQLPFPH